MNQILLMIFLFLMTHTICAEEVEKFYLKPLAENLSLIVLNFHETKDEHSTKLELIFLSYALRAHPSYANTLVNNFEKYSTSQKNIILHALYMNERKDIFKKLNITEVKFYKLFAYDEIDNMYLTYPKSIEQLNNQSKQLDYLWGAFFATGNKKYVNVMLDYMKREKNEFVKACAAEYLNRLFLSKLLASVGTESDEAKKMLEPTDLIEKLQKQDPDYSKYLVSRFMFYTTVWWSLQANKQLPPMEMHMKP